MVGFLYEEFKTEMLIMSWWVLQLKIYIHI